MHLGLSPAGLLSTTSSWEGKGQMDWWFLEWDGTKRNNLSGEEKVPFENLDETLSQSFRASLYAKQSPLLSSFPFCLKDCHYFIFFNPKFSCAPSLPALLHHKRNDTILNPCHLQNPAALALLGRGRCKALAPGAFWGEKASQLLPFVCCVLFSGCNLGFGWFLGHWTIWAHRVEWKPVFSPHSAFREPPTPQNFAVSWFNCPDTSREGSTWECAAWGTSFSPALPVWCSGESFLSRKS